MRVVVLPHLRDPDPVVARRVGVLSVREHLLVELLARPQAAVLDHDVPVGNEPRKGDHPPGEGVDLHALTHVEHEDLVAGRHRRRLHHQTAGLGDRHEEPRDLRMGHGHGTALRDLLPEPRDHGAVAAQHVAEPRRDEPRPSLDLALLDRESEGLDVYLCKTLRAAHDVRRVHRLVGRHHHHLLDVVLDALVGHVPRTCDVHSDRFARVLLHQRDVLVGSGVEHHLRPVLPEHVVQSRLLPHVADHRHEVKVLIPFLELEAQVVHRGLAVVEQHELLRAERSQLAAQLGADGACGAGHHHGLAAEVLDDGIHVQADLLAAQKVLDLDLADRRLHDPAVDHLVDRRGDEDLHAALLAVVDEPCGLLLHVLLAGEQDRVDEEPLAEEGDVTLALEVEDLDSVDVLAAEPAAVVQIAYHVVVHRVRETLHDCDRLVVDPVDHHVRPLPRGDHLLAEGVVGDDHRDAHGKQEDDRQRHVKHHQNGVVRVAEREGEHHRADGGGLEERRHADLSELLESRVAHDRAVCLQEDEEQEREQKREAEPAQDEAVGQAVVGDQHAHEDQGAH